MSLSPRVLFVGIDSAEPGLLLEWAGQGVLPNLQRLLEGSRWGRVANRPGFYAGAVWPSFWTGLSPTTHQRYCHTQLRPGSYEMVSTSPEDVRGEAFWDPLSRAGRRVAVIDVPKTRVSRNLNGIQLVDWGAADRMGETLSWPPELAAECLAAFGEDPIPNANGSRRKLEGYQELRDRLAERARRAGKLSVSLLESEAWDLFLTVFSEPHCIGHQCWHLHDPAHPWHDPEIAAALGDPLRHIYAAVDAELGELLSRAGPDTHVFVMSSHGMGPRYEANFLLDRVLRRLQGDRTSRAPERAAALAKHAWDLLPRGVRARLQLLRKPVKTRLDGSRRDISRERFFRVPNNNHFGAIRINVIGREPRGVVEPGREFEEVCDQLIADLSALVDLDTRRPAAAQVVRTRDLYPDDDVADLPDVLVEWSREAPHDRLYSPKTGAMLGTPHSSRSGDHKDEGLLLATGPGMRPGRLDAPVRMEDLAPTLAGLLDVDLPDCDGRDIMARLLG